ncbi:MAG TPA: STAS domain-containing protein [Vicinamibacterales bacterium]
MTISEEPHGRIHVLLLSGGLDGSTCGALASRIDALVADGRAQLLLDCGGLAYVSSAGLRVLLVGAKRTKAAGGSLSCCRLQPMVRQAFDLSGFGAVLAVHPDRVSALQALA